MNRDEIKSFVREITGRSIEFHDYDKWVSFSCLLAPWKHANKRDTSASAGISVAHGMSFYNCYACKTKGPLTRFLREYSQLSGKDFRALASEIETQEYLGGSLGEWGAMDEENTLGEPLDKEIYFDLYEPARNVPEAVRYLHSRGISVADVAPLNLLFDPKDSDGDARILFPVCSPNGDLHGFTGRALNDEARLKVRDYHGLKKKLLLLGSHLLSRQDEYIILVEGLFDVANLVSKGYPAVATMKSDLSKEQAQILRGYGRPVYVFYDDDQAGQDGKESVKEHLCKHVPVLKVRYPTEKRILDRKSGHYRAPNDPGELTVREVDRMLRDARLV